MLIGQQIGIVGAGVGGLAAATALALRGAQVQLFEQAPALGDVGAGVQIAPNGIAVLRALGVDMGAASRSDGVTLRDGRTGRQVMAMDFSAAPHQIWHRADLIAALADAAHRAGVQIKCGAKLARATQQHGGISLQFGGAGQRSFPLVVGADGLHSRLRALVLGPDAPAPAFTGHVAWRALVPAQGLDHPAQAQVHMGAGKHLVSYPVRGGQWINLVGVQARADWADEGWDIAGDPAQMRALYANFKGSVPKLLERVETARLWGLFRHPIAAQWHVAGAVLLGDAAHPTLPFMAQGACMALEDGYVLADCLAQAGGATAAFEMFRARRISRVRRIVDLAAANADIYHTSGLLRAPKLAAMRFAGAVAPAAMRGRFDWIYSYDATAGD